MNRWIARTALVVFFASALAGGEEAPVPSQGQKPFEEGVALMEAGDFDAAIPPLEKAIEADPQLAAAYYALAVCHAQKKNPDTAAARARHKEAMALGYQRNEWLETYCDELDKKVKSSPL